MQVESLEPYKESAQDKKKGNSFEYEQSDSKKKQRVQTGKPEERAKEGFKKEEKKERRST